MLKNNIYKNKAKLCLFPIFLIILFCILAYLNYRRLSLGLLNIINIDEYEFYNSLARMYQGFVELDLKKFFHFGFYSYGFIFFFLALLVSLPFFIVDQTEMILYLTKVLSSIFAVGSIYFIFRITKKNSSFIIAFLVVCLVLSMPSFWRNALWFHPDWMMAFFLIVSLFFYQKDQYQFHFSFWIGTFFFGVAIASKLQAITFYPFLFFYIFHSNISKANLSCIKESTLLLIKSVALTIIIFVVLNPYIVHPLGFYAWWVDFLTNIESNRTYHGSTIQLSWSEKINNAIFQHYLSPFLFLTLMGIICFSIFQFFQNKNDKKILFLSNISFYILINLVYLIFFVNKDWQHYYLSILMIASLLFATIKHNGFKYFLILLIGINLYFTFDQHKKNFISYDTTILEKQSASITASLQDQKIKNSLLIDKVPLNYDQLKINHHQVQVIYGFLHKKYFVLHDYLNDGYQREKENFRPKDFIILSKNSVYFDEEKQKTYYDKEGLKKALHIIKNFNQGGDLGYEPYGKNQYFYIWKKKQ